MTDLRLGFTLSGGHRVVGRVSRYVCSGILLTCSLGVATGLGFEVDDLGRFGEPSNVTALTTRRSGKAS